MSCKIGKEITEWRALARGENISSTEYQDIRAEIVALMSMCDNCPVKGTVCMVSGKS